MYSKSVFALLSLAAFMTVISSTARAGDPELIQHGQDEDVYRVTVNHDVEPFEVHAIFNDKPEWKTLTELRVCRGDELLQTFPIRMDQPLHESTEYFLMADMNVDGFDDMQVLSSWGVTGNASWLYWLYVPEKDRFEYNDQLVSVEAGWIDGNNRVISWWDGGHAGCIYNTRAYEWRGTELVLVIQAVQRYDEETDKYHKVVEVRQGYAMVVVSDRMLTPEEAMKESQEGLWFDY